MQSFLFCCFNATFCMISAISTACSLINQTCLRWCLELPPVFSSIHRLLKATRSPKRRLLTCSYCGAVVACARYRGNVAMRLTRRADEAYFVGQWILAPFDFLAHLSASVIDGVQLPATRPGIRFGPVQHTCYLFVLSEINISFSRCNHHFPYLLHYKTAPPFSK